MTITAAQIASRAHIMPGTQTISYQAKNSSGFDAAVSVPLAEKRPLTAEDVQTANLDFTAENAVWHLWESQLGSVAQPLKPGDKFTDAASAVWYVIGGGTSSELLEQRIRLIAQKEKTES